MYCVIDILYYYRIYCHNILPRYRCQLTDAKMPAKYSFTEEKANVLHESEISLRANLCCNLLAREILHPYGATARRQRIYPAARPTTTTTVQKVLVLRVLTMRELSTPPTGGSVHPLKLFDTPKTVSH